MGLLKYALYQFLTSIASVGDLRPCLGCKLHKAPVSGLYSEPVGLSLFMMLLASGFLGVRKLCSTVAACMTKVALCVLRYILLSKTLQH